MHVVAALLHEGHKIGVIDLDVDQGTLTRYVENRRVFAEKRDVALLLPELRRVEPSADTGLEREAFEATLTELALSCDFVVIDTPGRESNLSFIGHSHADTLVTPLNDSFVDLDVLARVDPDSYRVRHPSRYAAAVWEIRKQRALRDRGSVDWIVLRNRLTAVDAHNKRAMASVLEALAPRIGFRLAPGLSERVIYRELFLSGLTLLDLRSDSVELRLKMSHVAARQELRALAAALRLAKWRPAVTSPSSAKLSGPEMPLSCAGGRGDRTLSSKSRDSDA